MNNTPIANAICRIRGNAEDSLRDLDKLLSKNSDFERMPEFRYIKDALQSIFMESSLLDHAIGYRVDEWYLDYLTK